MQKRKTMKRKRCGVNDHDGTEASVADASANDQVRCPFTMLLLLCLHCHEFTGADACFKSQAALCRKTLMQRIDIFYEQDSATLQRYSIPQPMSTATFRRKLRHPVQNFQLLCVHNLAGYQHTVLGLCHGSAMATWMRRRWKVLNGLQQKRSWRPDQPNEMTRPSPIYNGVLQLGWAQAPTQAGCGVRRNETAMRRI